MFTLENVIKNLLQVIFLKISLIFFSVESEKLVNYANTKNFFRFIIELFLTKNQTDFSLCLRSRL